MNHMYSRERYEWVIKFENSFKRYVRSRSKTSPPLEVEESSRRIFDSVAWISFSSYHVSFPTENMRICCVDKLMRMKSWDDWVEEEK